MEVVGATRVAAARTQCHVTAFEHRWLKEGNLWLKKYIAIEHNLLILEDERHQRQIIVLKQFEIIIAEEHYRRIVLRCLAKQLSHALIAEPIELRLRNIVELERDQDDLEDYVKLLTAFK